MEQK
jgi:hypothetical protein